MPLLEAILTNINIYEFIITIGICIAFAEKISKYKCLFWRWLASCDDED